MQNLSCCGSSCGDCACYGTMCKGCNESEGAVFFMPEGQACPIYNCAKSTKKLVSCGSCAEAPCQIWRDTRDPKLTDEEFADSIRVRLSNMQGDIEKSADHMN